ncbi:hypothetical protein OHA10_16890 [Kribbella sp. NBC_00662]|jgi:hypothetical protein|uniref:hypothetical protein n=1 Tax=Kribbella sp. NBC_00662 TaxID=2975969 RepID=UPI0032551AAE
MNKRTITAVIGLSALLLGGITTSSAAAAAPPAPGPTVVKHSVDDGHCDQIRFLAP